MPLQRRSRGQKRRWDFTVFGLAVVLGNKVNATTWLGWTLSRSNSVPVLRGDYVLRSKNMRTMISRKVPTLEATTPDGGDENSRRLRVTPNMVEAGELELLSEISEEWISWRAPRLARAVNQVYRAMAALAPEESR